MLVSGSVLTDRRDLLAMLSRVGGAALLLGEEHPGVSPEPGHAPETRIREVLARRRKGKTNGVKVDKVSSGKGLRLDNASKE